MKTKTFEIYDNATEQVIDVVETTQEFADRANKLARETDTNIRYIEQTEPPHNHCTCGAEFNYECVCF